MLYTIKNEKANESNDKLINRAKKLLQRSRLLSRVKQDAYHVKKKTKRLVRQAAIIRAMHRKRRKKEQFYN